MNGASTHFLRGHQKTNSKGVARFATIYPGWYQGRAPHIHMKVHVGARDRTAGVRVQDYQAQGQRQARAVSR